MTAGVREKALAMEYFWVAIGGALGSMARYAMSGFIAALTGGTFPYGTLVVNVTGAILIGFLATLTSPDSRFFIPASGRIFMMTGICGGYTTFSTFSLETANLMRDGEWTAALANVGFSVILCLMAIWIGHAGALVLNRLRGA
jgi:CrcB protein